MKGLQCRSDFSPTTSTTRISQAVQGAHTICLCSRLLFYSKGTGFTVCLTYRQTVLSWSNLSVVFCTCGKWIVQRVEHRFVLTGICVLCVKGKIKMTSLFHRLIVLEEIADQAIKQPIICHSWPKLANCRFKCPCPIYTKERESRKHSDLITRGGTSHVSTNATMQSSPVLKRGGIQKLIWTLTRILARNRVQSKLDEPHLKQTPNF